MQYNNSATKHKSKIHLGIHYVYHCLTAYNQPYLVLPIRNYYQTSSIFILDSVLYGLCPAYLAMLDSYSQIAKTYMDNKGLASLQTGLLITCWICFDMTLPFSTANNPSNILYWILASHTQMM